MTANADTPAYRGNPLTKSRPPHANDSADARGLRAWREAEIARLERLAGRMDSAFRIPGTRIRMGWDSIVGLVPGLGDAAAMAPGLYIIWRAHRLGVPTSTLTRMGVNSAFDWAIGSIPLLGDIFDVGFKANLRNAALIRRHFDGHAADPAQAPSADARHL